MQRRKAVERNASAFFDRAGGAPAYMSKGCSGGNCNPSTSVRILGEARGSCANAPLNMWQLIRGSLNVQILSSCAHLVSSFSQTPSGIMITAIPADHGLHPKTQQPLPKPKYYDFSPLLSVPPEDSMLEDSSKGLGFLADFICARSPLTGFL